MKHKFSVGLTLALILAMLVTSLALADEVVPDGDIVASGNQSSVNLGTVAPGAVLTPEVSFTLVCDSAKHVDNGQTVNLAFSLAQSTVPAGGDLSATATSIGAIPSLWPDDTTGSGNCGSTPPTPLNDNGNSTVTITAPMTPGGPYIYKVRYLSSLSPAGNNDSSSIKADHVDITYTLTVSAPANTPPSVSVTGVSNGSPYEFGSVPAAGCSVIDAEDGISSFPATLSAITGPLSAYGLGSQTASCAYTDGGGLSASASATYSIVDTTRPVIDAHGDETAEATGPDGAIVNYTSPATHDAVFGDGVASCASASGSLFGLGDTTVTCNAIDGAGNAAAPTTFVVHVVDTIPPDVTVPADITAEATGPSGAVVTFITSANDLVDGALTPTCDYASGSTFPLGTTTVTCSATDAHSNKGSASFNVIVQDTTPPVVTVPSDITAEATGPSGAVVSFSASASDLVDGSLNPTCAPVSGSTFPLGTTTVTCSATDAHGNTGSANFNVIVQDTTPPALVSCDLPDGIWHANDVTLYCYYTDLVSGSSQVALSTSVTGGTETNNASASAGGAKACDAAGNCADSPADISGNMVDKKAPQQTSCDSPDGIWHADDVTLYCHYTDGGSGPATQDIALSTNVAAGIETDNAIASAGGAQACDNVNNCAATPADIEGNKIDKKAPTITITVPDAGPYLLNQPVAANYACNDGGSGVASCVGTVANGSNIDTVSVSSKSFAVNATDNVGNVASPASVTYNVQYATAGMCYGGPGHTILQPINAEGSSIFKQKSTVPAKFRVCDYYGNSIGDPGVVASFKLVQIVTGLDPNGTVESTDAADVDSTANFTEFRWSDSDQQWIFNINTKNLKAQKTYFYQITLNDGSTIEFNFGLK